MHIKTTDTDFSCLAPLSVVEEFFFQCDWEYDYLNESEITTESEGRWCNYRLFVLWKEDLECLMFTSFMDLKVPINKREPIATLLSLINPKIWLGHFEIAPEEEIPVFRYTLTLRGNPTPTLEQIEEIITTASHECDRLYPALQFVLWGGKSPEEALMAAMMDTYGEA